MQSTVPGEADLERFRSRWFFPRVDYAVKDRYQRLQLHGSISYFSTKDEWFVCTTDLLFKILILVDLELGRNYWRQSCLST